MPGILESGLYTMEKPAWHILWKNGICQGRKSLPDYNQCDLECEEVAGSAAEVGAACSKPSDWNILSYLGYLLIVSIPLLKTIFCSESWDELLGSVFLENKCLTAAEHVIKGCHMGHLLTMKNECTICQAVIEMEEQFQFSLPLLIWLSVSQSINGFLPYNS